MFKKILFLILIVGSVSLVFAADGSLSQVIKGQVIDQKTKAGLSGANVMIAGTSLGASTDIDGYFRIDNVPLGRQTVEFMYIGYKTRIIPEILVGSAKEVVLTAELEEDIMESEAIIVRPVIEKNKPENSMTTVSARSFTVEETQRYAGGFDDPARLASSFAGVTYGNAQDNGIIIRGNAPKGLLWRLEGIEIPNPNHFPDGNVFGGGMVTIFSNQLLTNSDFMTGAFPAEYGNALSGVFDMKLRNGNSEKREWTLQAGVMGIDLATEGPFSANGNASYLVNYRYSTIGLLTDLNIINTDQELRYQDLSFKLNFPTKTLGTLSLWGIGSIDQPSQAGAKDSTLWEHEWDQLNFDARFRVGAAGLNHRYIIGQSTFVNSTLATTFEEVYSDQTRLDKNYVPQEDEYIDSFNGKTVLTSVVNHKFSPRLSSTTGLVWNYLNYNMKLQSTVDDIPETFQTFVDEEGNSQLLQTFSQMQYNLADNIKLNAGLHYAYFLLNRKDSFEPRLGLTWSVKSRHTFSFGYGKHSQLENIRYYLAQRQTEDGIEQPNKNLGFTHADHFILGYDYQISEHTRLKIEPYYQRLYDVPVKDGASFSFINLKDERYINDPLENKGTGDNIGIDLTLERFLNDNYYYLVTASVFDSKYTGGDGIEHNSRYNRNYVFNILAGKEYNVRNTNILGINGRFTLMGGERISPLLYEQSLSAKMPVYDESRAFAKSLNKGVYLDITASYRINHPGMAHIISLQVKNILGSPNDHGYVYNYKENDMQRDRMTIVLPSISYKVEF